MGLCASGWWEAWSGIQCWGGRYHQSIWKLRVCPQGPPQPPPTGTALQLINSKRLHFNLQHSYLSSVRVLSFNFISSLTCLSARRSPRVRHGICKPRPSSVELSSDLKDMSEGEDVFYTYRASVSSSKDGEDASVKLVSLSSSQAHFSLAVFLSSWTTFLTRIRFNAVYYTKSNSFCNKCLIQVLKRTSVQQ